MRNTKTALACFDRKESRDRRQPGHTETPRLYDPIRRCLSGFVLVFLSVISLFAADQTPPSAHALLSAVYLGEAATERVQAITFESDGSFWVAGVSVGPADFPGPNVPFQDAVAGGHDIFVAQYQPNPDGGFEVAYWTWLGGRNDEDVVAISRDSNGRIYLTGSTKSTDFPTTGNAFQADQQGSLDAYVAVIDPSLSGEDSLVYSSYFGGDLLDDTVAISVDASGAFVILGYTSSTTLAGVTGGVQETHNGAWDCFVARFDPTVVPSLTYASYLGGEGAENPSALTIDPSGNIWLTGYTTSQDFPMAGSPYRSELSGMASAFLTKINPHEPGVGGLAYSTYFGGTTWDAPQKIIVDLAGMVWVSGFTLSADYPTTPDAYQSTLGLLANVFVTAFDLSRPPDQIVVYSTYFGDYADLLYDMALVGSGKVALTGYTFSDNFPVTEGALAVTRRSLFADSFVSVLDTKISGPAALEYSTYFGGFSTDLGSVIESDVDGRLSVFGYTDSPDLPVTDDSTKPSPAAIGTGFILKIDQ